MPVVAVVIATKDRPAQLARLLDSVQDQDLQDFECVVVDDQSSADTKAQYAPLWQRLDARFMLVERPSSGGPAEARNAGIEQTTAPFVAFCDDDDRWIRGDHLSAAVHALEAGSADLYFADMQTALRGEVRNPSWYAELKSNSLLTASQHGQGLFHVGIDQLARFFRHRILHADTLVVRRTLLERVGGYWPRIRFAEDHDFCYRLADEAKGIIFRADVCAEFDITPTPSLSRSFSEHDRILFGMLASMRVESIVKNKLLRRVAKANRAWRLLELARLLDRGGQRTMAREMAIQSLLVHPSAAGLKTLATLMKRPGSPGAIAATTIMLAVMALDGHSGAAVDALARVFEASETVRAEGGWAHLVHTREA